MYHLDFTWGGIFALAVQRNLRKSSICYLKTLTCWFSKKDFHFRLRRREMASSHTNYKGNLSYILYGDFSHSNWVDSFWIDLTHLSHESWLIYESSDSLELTQWLILMSRDSDESWLMTHEYFNVPISIWVMILHESNEFDSKIWVTSCERNKEKPKIRG